MWFLDLETRSVREITLTNRNFSTFYWSGGGESESEAQSALVDSNSILIELFAILISDLIQRTTQRNKEPGPN